MGTLSQKTEFVSILLANAQHHPLKAASNRWTASLKAIDRIVLALVILEIDIPHRPMARVQHRLDHAVPAAPRLLRESAHQIGSIQQRARAPDLAVAHPAPVDPVDQRRVLAHHVQDHPRARRRLALQQPGLEQRQDAAADGQEGGALLVRLADEGFLGLARLVAHVVRAHEHDVERRA